MPNGKWKTNDKECRAIIGRGKEGETRVVEKVWNDGNMGWHENISKTQTTKSVELSLGEGKRGRQEWWKGWEVMDEMQNGWGWQQNIGERQTTKSLELLLEGKIRAELRVVNREGSCMGIMVRVDLEGREACRKEMKVENVRVIVALKIDPENSWKHFMVSLNFSSFQAVGP